MANRSKRRSRSSSIYLVYLLFLIFQPIFDPFSSALSWWFAVALVVVFVPIYLWTFSHIEERPYFQAKGRPAPGALWGVLTMMVLGVVAIPINSGATTFFIYSAGAVGSLRPRNRALAWLGAIMVVVVASAFLTYIPFPYSLAAFLPAFILVPVLGFTGIAESAQRRANLRLRMAQDEIERLATIAERERIARDLHDLLGHTLSTITLKSELASKLVTRDSDRAAAEMRDVERISRDALAQVRAAVRGYRSQGLRGEVANTKLALEASSIGFDYYLETMALPPDRESVLALALREAVTNVIRHAKAGHCAVRIQSDGTFVDLQVDDDGVGGADLSGNGLSAMRARLETLGGTLRIEPRRPGTRLQVTLPIQPAGAAASLLGAPAT